MMNSKMLRAVVCAGALAVPMASTGLAQGPIVTGGLVNLTIVDLVDIRDINVNLNLRAALNIAANVCDTTVAVLAADFAPDGAATCTNGAQTATITGQ